MAPLPGRRPPPAPAKQYAWSYSKLKNFDSCPKRHYEIDIAKNYVEKQEVGGPLDWGNRVHDALAKACMGKQELPTEMEHFQKWVDAIRRGPGELLVEQKFAIDKNFMPVGYFDRTVWYRGIGDVVRIWGPVALVVDWKTGKVLEDSVQLMLMAQCIFSKYPTVKKVRSEFIWLKEDCTSPEVFDRAEVADAWVDLMPRVLELERAHATQNYPPKPNYLCKSWCPVTGCTFHGKGGR